MMKFLKGLLIVAVLITIFKAAGLEKVLDMITDPSSVVPNVQIGK